MPAPVRQPLGAARINKAGKPALEPVRKPLEEARINKAGTPALTPVRKPLVAAQGHAIDEADRRGRPSDMIPRPIRAA